MSLKLVFLYFMLTFVFYQSCSTSLGLPKGWQFYKEGSFSFTATKGFEKGENYGLPYQVYVNDQKDSIIIFYENNYPTPTPLEWSFRDAFNAYHFNKFFDQVFMDPKVKKIFRDSVQIMEVVPIPDIVAQNNECSNCNAVAKLKFKKKIFDYHYQVDNNKILMHQKYDFTLQDSGKMRSVTYFDKQRKGHAGKTVINNGKRSGLLVKFQHSSSKKVIETIIKSIKYESL